MSLKLINARVCDQNSPFHNEKVCIEIEKGIIKTVRKSPRTTAAAIDLKGALVTPGLVDLSSSFNDPGFEYKEDVLSGLATARAGGFTHVCVWPNTDPVIDSKSGVEYLLSRANGHQVSLLPVGAISANAKDENLSEILDLSYHGAVAFSGGLRPVLNSELLLKALQYTAKFGGLVINRPQDIDLARFGQMHEGEVSTQMGLRGIPDIAETIMIDRDLSILEYTGGRLHFSGISSARSVDIIKKAKQKGLNVTCDVPVHNLIFSEKELDSFDSNFKVNPPLRTEKDRQALIKGLESDIIDAITSDHQPQDTENKNLEFDLADFGMIGLQTLVHYINQLQSEISLAKIFSKLNQGPRRILNLEPVSIENGNPAIISIFDLDAEWNFDDKTNLSKSRNSPLFGKTLKGRSIGIINGRKHFFSSGLK